MKPLELAQAMLDAVRAQHFERTADAMRGGAPVEHMPSLDLAVAAFPAGAAPVFANVLFSREHPQGLVADIDSHAGPVRNLRFLADQQDEQGRSVAWLPGSDWSSLQWTPLMGDGPHRFVAPYPASLLKLMVLVGVARLVDQGRTAWAQTLSFDGSERPVGDWAFDMTVISCNRSTSALVTLLHAAGAIGPARNELHELFASLDLHGLRLANTQPDGGWGNAAGAGVGQLQMTAWDTVRLLWLIDPDAPPAPWLQGSEPLARDLPDRSPEGMKPSLGRPGGQLANHAPLLGPSREHLLHCLREQRLHQILSSGSLRGLPGWVEGLPDDVLFAHKTGNTENYSADAGIVRGLGRGIKPARRHYLIALTSNLGSRYAAGPGCATTWRLPALGAAVDAFLRKELEC